MRTAVLITATVAASILLPVAVAQAQKLDARGDWELFIDGSGLQAGQPPPTTYENPPGDVTLRVIPQGNHSWEVSVRRVDAVWHSGLDLSVRRTGDGNGGGDISGGTAYQSIGISDATFFSGSKVRNNVPLQFRLQFTPQVPVAEYDTDVTFTLTILGD